MAPLRLQSVREGNKAENGATLVKAIVRPVAGAAGAIIQALHLVTATATGAGTEPLRLRSAREGNKVENGAT